MGNEKGDEAHPNRRLDLNLLELLSQFSEIELEDVELEIGDLEISLQPSMVMPRVELQKIPTLETVKPTALVSAQFQVSHVDYPGKIVEVKLGATKREGGSRRSSIVIGGEQAPSYYLFESPVVHPPVIAFDVFDKPPPLARAMRAPFEDVLNDPAAWAKRCVNKFEADVIQLHLTSIDPLLTNTTPTEAAKTVENVLQAVDVPLAVGGCGDPQKDLAVFEKVAEVAQGERLLINSVTLDMDVKKIELED